MSCTPRILALALLPLGLALAAAADTVAKELPARPGGSLVLDLESGGSVSIRVWDRDLVSVRAERGGRDGAEVLVEIEPTSDGVRVQSQYAGRKSSYSTDLDFEIQVPGRFDVVGPAAAVGDGGFDGVVRGEVGGQARELPDRVLAVEAVVAHRGVDDKAEPAAADDERAPAAQLMSLPSARRWMKPFRLLRFWSSGACSRATLAC
jgi:hypothetical protein